MSREWSMVRGRGVVAVVLGVVAALVVAVLVWTNEGTPGSADAAPPPTGSASGADASSGEGTGAEPEAPGEQLTVEPQAARRVGAVVPEKPLEVRLPGTDFLRVAEVGTRGNGLLDVPSDVRQVGWWEGGSRIGDPFGSVLMAGHVDSATQGLGPSSVLLTAQEGERVDVRTESRTTRYEVTSRRLVPLDDLASYPRVLSASGPARLTLVTCAPPFVESAGGYQNLAVVEARPVTTTQDR